LNNKISIVHILHRSKFAVGYIEFMREYFRNYEHRFILLRDGDELQLEKTEDILFIEQYDDLFSNREINDILCICDKVIVSGVWNMLDALYKCGKVILNKTYFHFWGGDFYRYRSIPYKPSQWKERKNKFLLKRCMKQAAGVINLIEDDYSELKRIMKIKDVKHFVAPMCKNPKEDIDYSMYRNIPKEDDIIRILVGNSATVHNQHQEILEILERFKEEKIVLYCPLSYGWKEYGDSIIELGKRLFGDKFIPLTEQMPKDEYVKFLATCDIGIYNNNRQQAMGNISILARLGKKVYLRDDTAMWSHFEKIGYRFNKINELKDATIEEIAAYSEDTKSHNVMARENYEKQMIVLWSKVLCDNG